MKVVKMPEDKKRGWRRSKPGDGMAWDLISSPHETEKNTDQDPPKDDDKPKQPDE